MKGTHRSKEWRQTAVTEEGKWQEWAKSETWKGRIFTHYFNSFSMEHQEVFQKQRVNNWFKNSMGRGAWQATVHGVAKNWTWLSLLLGRKVMTNLDSILKSRDITLPTKVHLVKAMVFTVVMYGCESWTVKKAERRRIDAFELVLEKTL